MPSIHHAELLRRLQQAGLYQGAGARAGSMITDVTCDSRTAGPGSCFVAIRGSQANGLDYVDHAIARGAAMVVSESAVQHEEVSCVQVSRARVALSLCAAALYGDPAQQLACIGITGTNGKTTTAWILHHVLQQLGERSGLLGSIAYAYGSRRTEASLTTPSAPALQHMLREMVGIGCRWCVMEVSSHALDQRRVYGIPFSAAVFTNLRQDHLDYHKTLKAYVAAKKRLFDGLAPEAVVVCNADDRWGSTMVRHTEAAVVAYGQSSRADVRFVVQDHRPRGLRLRLDGQMVDLRFSGTFNAYNVVAAYAVARARGFPPAEVLAALAEVSPPPGRFEPIRCEDGTLAIVDYAHTPDALEQVLKAARRCVPQGRLWCVFGCGGDRDREKRPMMGAVAERWADHVIVTSDNLRSESFEDISGDIRQGMRHPRKASWIEDRREAVGHVVRRAGAGDVVLVAGKGHESFQISNGEARPLSDRQLVLEAFVQRLATH